MSEPSPIPAEDNSTEPDLSGRRLGDYQLLRRLGRGGMADVYLAEQISLGRKVAFKVLRRHLSGDENYVRRFQNEARAAAALVHSNIVQVHEVGRVEGIYFIVQEYVAGQNLRQLLARSGAVDVRLAINIMRQVAAALHKAGQHNIVHRDIKPDNIMLSSHGEVKVADFGLARVAVDGAAMNLTQVGVTMGTPLYMSPEQVEGKPVDQRSDLYSFGVTCYHMLAARTPFEGDNVLSIAVQHLKTEPPRLEQLRPDIPSGLCRIVHTLLAKRPDDRYAQATDLLRELRSLQVEGVEEAWPADMDEWSTADLLALNTARVAATQQLDLLMKTESQQQSQRPAFQRWVMGAVASFAIGAGFAWLLQPAPILEARGSNLPTVEKKGTVQEQFIYGVAEGTEAALKSIPQFFPPSENPLNQHYADLAQASLAGFYLSHLDLVRAEQEYTELSKRSNTDNRVKATAYIGLANVKHRANDHAGAVKHLAQVIDLAKNLDNNARETIKQQVDPKLRPELDRLLREFSGPDDSPRPPNPRASTAPSRNRPFLGS